MFFGQFKWVKLSFALSFQFLILLTNTGLCMGIRHNTPHILLHLNIHINFINKMPTFYNYSHTRHGPYIWIYINLACHTFSLDTDSTKSIKCCIFLTTICIFFGWLTLACAFQSFGFVETSTKSFRGYWTLKKSLYIQDIYLKSINK